MPYALPEIYTYFQDQEAAEKTDPEVMPMKKPWEQNKVDLDKYFNYGFNEDTWKIHCKDVLSRAKGIETLAKLREY